MSSLYVEIPKAIQAVMVASDDFSDIAGWAVGDFSLPPQSSYPLCEIIATPEQTAAQASGTLVRAISGFVRFSVMMQETYAPDPDGVIVIASYAAVAEYADAFRQLFEMPTHYNLGNPALADGSRVEMIQIGSTTDIGAAARGLNDPEHESLVDWRVTIQRNR